MKKFNLFGFFILISLCLYLSSCVKENNPVKPQIIRYSKQLVQDAPLPIYATASIYVPFEEKIYFFGGRTDKFSDELLNIVLIYDIKKNQWEQLDNILPYGIIATTLATDNNTKIFIAPGIGPLENNGWGIHKKIIEYNIKSKEAKEVGPDLAEYHIWGCDLAFHNEILYIFGGWNGMAIDRAWKYLPNKDTLIELTEKLPKATHLDYVWKENNKIYLVGGHTARAIQVFDPKSEKFELLGEFSTNDILDWAFAVFNFCNNISYLITPYSYQCFYISLQNGLIKETNIENDLTFLLDYQHFPEVVQLPDGRIFFCGGIDKNGGVSNKAFFLIPNK